MTDSKQKAAIITGGAKRIGRHVALRLAEIGYDIALHYNRSQKEAENVKQQIQEVGQKCELFKADFMNTKEVSDLIPHIFSIFPGCNLLINNASIYNSGSFKETDIDALQRQYRINFEVPYQLSRDFAKNQAKGHIINIIDTKINQLAVNYFGYTLSKKALYEFTKMAARELAPGIRVNGICPGPILPPPGEDDEYLKQRSETLPLKRAGNPEVIAKTVLFLLDNYFITGECIHVDGGEHLIY